MVGTEQEREQGSREAAGERRSLHLRGDESSDGKEISTLMRLFGQFQGEVDVENLFCSVGWSESKRKPGCSRRGESGASGSTMRSPL